MKHGDYRLVQRIAWIPRCLEGKWYWLRKLYVVQRYRTFHALVPEMKHSPMCYTWDNISWHREVPARPRRGRWAIAK